MRILVLLLDLMIVNLIGNLLKIKLIIIIYIINYLNKIGNFVKY